MIAPLRPEFETDDELLLALCVWREARGEPYEAKLGVVWTIRNRIAMAPAEGFKHDIRSNVLKPWAFSSFMQGDPNAVKYPVDGDASWEDCKLAAADEYNGDNTGGAVFYYSLPITQPPRAWGKVDISARIAGLTFCKLLTEEKHSVTQSA